MGGQGEGEWLTIQNLTVHIEDFEEHRYGSGCVAGADNGQFDRGGLAGEGDGVFKVGEDGFLNESRGGVAFFKLDIVEKNCRDVHVSRFGPVVAEPKAHEGGLGGERKGKPFPLLLHDDAFGAGKIAPCGSL